MRDGRFRGRRQGVGRSRDGDDCRDYERGDGDDCGDGDRHGHDRGHGDERGNGDDLEYRVGFGRGDDGRRWGDR